MRIDLPQAPGGGGGLAVMIVPDGDNNPPPRSCKLIVGGCMIGGILIEVGSNPLLAFKPNRSDMTGQLPLAITDLLIQCTQAPRSHEQRRDSDDTPTQT